MTTFARRDRRGPRLRGRYTRRIIMWLGGLLAALLVVAAPGAPPALAQGGVQDGATLTVLRGQVAVIHADGGAVQPAPSGMIVRIGDEIRTLTQSGALITLFAGTEIEMGEDTSLIVDRINSTGDEIDISLRQVFGASLHRVQSLGNRVLNYRVEIDGAVAVVRGTTFLLYGPTDENVVGILCLDDCTPATTFAGCPMAPNLGYWVEVDRGQVVSRCNPIRADGSIWNTPGTLRLTQR